MKFTALLVIVCTLPFSYALTSNANDHLNRTKQPTIIPDGRQVKEESVHNQKPTRKSTLNWTVEFLRANVYDSIRTHLSPKFSLRNQGQSVAQIESIHYYLISNRNGDKPGKLVIEYVDKKSFNHQPLTPDSSMNYIGRYSLTIDKLFVNKSYTDPFAFYLVSRVVYRDLSQSRNEASYLLKKIDAYPVAKRPRVYPFVWYLQFDLLPLTKQELAQLKDVLTETEFDYKKLLLLTL